MRFENVLNDCVVHDGEKRERKTPQIFRRLILYEVSSGDPLGNQVGPFRYESTGPETSAAIHVG